MTPHQRNTLLAASLAGDVTADLLRFHIDGPGSNAPFGQGDPVAMLAEALLRTARAEADMLGERAIEIEYRSSLGQLTAACVRFLEDECGGAPAEIAGGAQDEDA